MSNEMGDAMRLIDLRSDDGDRASSSTLLETLSLKLVQIKLETGRETPKHEASGEVLIECHRGRVRVSTPRGETQLAPGQLLFLVPYLQHSLYGLSDSVVTVMNFSDTQPRDCVIVDKDVVQEASEESFPASDPPSWTPTTSP